MTQPGKLAQPPSTPPASVTPSSNIIFPDPRKRETPPSHVTPTITSSFVPPSVPSFLTQEVIDSVKSDISSLRSSFPPPTESSRDQFISMGQEVRELKKEVQYLVRSLQNSMRHKQILQRKLDYFERKEEDELVKMSMEHDEQKDHHYSKSSTALTPFSRNSYFPPNFNH